MKFLKAPGEALADTVLKFCCWEMPQQSTHFSGYSYLRLYMSPFSIMHCWNCFLLTP